MKVITFLGTRPEIIRLSLIIKKLDDATDHVLVHTGQNFSKNLKDIFFKELEVRKPDYYLGAEASSAGGQLATILKDGHRILEQQRPEKVLILGDTNSGLITIMAEKMGIPVYHMEAGNRCHDREVPEEINRHLIDSIASINLPYTPGSRENLLREGGHPQHIITTGNPINEVLNYYSTRIESSDILNRLELQEKKYFIVTAHRAENVDNEKRLKEIVCGLELVAAKYQLPIVCSIHPRTKQKIEQFGVTVNSPLIRMIEPLGFFDFVKLEKNALCAISDSGTVQEECCIFHVPTVTIRMTTERPETVQCGSNIIAGLDGQKICDCVDYMVNGNNNWTCPAGYLDTDVSDKIIKIMLSKRA